MAKAGKGVPGSAVLFGTVGLYLVYVGVKDIPFFEGLRSILRKEKPTPKTEHIAWKPKGKTGDFSFDVDATPRPGDAGISKLVGNAKNAYNIFRGMGSWTIYGWGLRPNPSDHMSGKALDIMRPTQAEASQIIATFRGMPGAKYWIWNRTIANKYVNNWAERGYRGTNPHTDHVHLSFE